MEIEKARNIVIDGWTKGTRTFASTTTLINYKLRPIRAAICRWSRNIKGLQVLIDNNKHVIEYLNAVEERRTLSAPEFSLRNHVTHHSRHLILWQTTVWKCRAKLKQCVLGDENMRFFHAVANMQAKRNKIRVFVKDDIEFFDNKDKLKIATDYFRELFGQPSPSLPVLQLNDLYSPADLSALSELFSLAEIVSDINQSPNNRSPGLMVSPMTSTNFSKIR